MITLSLEGIPCPLLSYQSIHFWPRGISAQVAEIVTSIEEIFSRSSQIADCHTRRTVGQMFHFYSNIQPECFVTSLSERPRCPIVLRVQSFKEFVGLSWIELQTCKIEEGTVCAQKNQRLSLSVGL